MRRRGGLESQHETLIIASVTFQHAHARGSTRRRRAMSAAKDSSSKSAASAAALASDGPSDAFKQFVELQTKYADATSQMKGLRDSVRMREHERTRAKLTNKEMEAVDDSTRLFKPLGRSFVLESKETLVKGLEEASAAATTDIENAMARREYLMKQLSEAEMNLRELMQGNEALAKELQERGVV